MNTDVRELMMAGAHFGHRTRFWNPKMAPYIYCEYHSTHIINLDHTLVGMERALKFLKSVAATDGKVLFLCTKRNSGEVIEEEVKATGMPYVSRRWLGGILTNFKTTRDSVGRLESLEASIEEGALKSMTKKEGIKLMGAKDKLEKTIGGIRSMTSLPDALFVIDAGWHRGAIAEARKLGIPVVAVVDTNHSPQNIDYVIPGNDDSLQAIKIYVREAIAAVAEGKKEWEKNLVAEVAANREEGAAGDRSKKGSLSSKAAALAEEKKSARRVIRAKAPGKQSEANVVVEEKSEKVTPRPIPSKAKAPVEKPAVKKAAATDKTKEEQTESS